MSVTFTRLGMLTTIATIVASPVVAQQPPVHSFDQLQVTSGQQVIVKPHNGRTVKGRVVSLSAGQLELERRRWTFRRERRVFTEEAVQQIQIRDSDWNGFLIGAGMGVLSAVLIEANCPSGTTAAYGCALADITSILIGSGVGAAIDAAINRPIYTSRSVRSVTVSPLVEPTRIGVIARVRFRAECCAR